MLFFCCAGEDGGAAVTVDVPANDIASFPHAPQQPTVHAAVTTDPEPALQDRAELVPTKTVASDTHDRNLHDLASVKVDVLGATVVTNPASEDGTKSEPPNAVAPNKLDRKLHDLASVEVDMRGNMATEKVVDQDGHIASEVCTAAMAAGAEEISSSQTGLSESPLWKFDSKDNMDAAITQVLEELKPSEQKSEESTSLTPQEQSKPRMNMVDVTRSKADPDGIVFDVTNTRMPFVLKIPNGSLFDVWNFKTIPDHRVYPGDGLVSVDGQSGDGLAMIKALREFGDHSVVFQRPCQRTLVLKRDGHPLGLAMLKTSQTFTGLMVVRATGKAAEAGIKTGDRIMSVNGMRDDPEKMFSLLREMRFEIIPHEDVRLDLVTFHEP